MKTRSLRSLVATLAVAALFVAGCGRGDTSSNDATTIAGSSPTGSTPDVKGEITVSAAASLTEVFGRLADGFHAAHPDATITPTFDSSKTLAGQILDGAEVDLFASADEASMELLTDEGLIHGKPRVFARNRLVIVTKPGNPEGIERLSDLAEAGVISLCGEDVPCGRFAQQSLDAARVTLDEGSVTRGQNAKATLTAVTEGDAVAGIVYVTDAQAAGDEVETVEIPDAVNAIATYPIGVLKGAADAEVAEAFEAFVLSDEGQATLKEFGFLAPA